MRCENHDGRSIDRRSFVKASLIPATLALPGLCSPLSAGLDEPSGGVAPAAPEIVDTNVHVFEWPFRKLKYARTDALVAKLRRHRITQAWAGSFEAVLHKQLDLMNRRLADECRTNGDGMLIPFGSVNPAWHDWEEDLRRCHETYHMPGVRLYPGYHGYTLDHPEFLRMLGAAANRGMLVQIAVRLEDDRVHHVAIDAPDVNVAPLLEGMKKIPQARVQLIHSGWAVRGGRASALIHETQVTVDISAVEGNGGLGRLIEGTYQSFQGRMPVERLLFGSHAPFFPCESALLKLFESPLSVEQLEQLMRTNAQRLLK